jgi:thioesterase domain-containing protein
VEKEQKILYDDGLSEIIDTLEVFSVPGDHISMLHDPHVERLVEIIKNKIGRLSATTIRGSMRRINIPIPIEI